jgi:hypothetical protein
VKDANEKGGIMVKEFGKRIPVEVVANCCGSKKADDRRTRLQSLLLHRPDGLRNPKGIEFIPWATQV